MLGGALIWAADFFLLYGIVSVFLTTPLARIASLVVTAVTLAADMWLMWYAWRRTRLCEDEYERWIAGIAFVIAALAAVAILWQGLPAIYISSPAPELGLLGGPVSV